MHDMNLIFAEVYGFTLICLLLLLGAVCVRAIINAWRNR